VLSRLLTSIVRLYQLVISPWTLASCRFTPTCSSYALESIERYGAGRGSWFALKRITRCHPWGGHGYDPIPLPSDKDETSVSVDRATLLSIE
jgi:putative membrane protein insertion efficiency factor